VLRGTQPIEDIGANDERARSHKRGLSAEPRTGGPPPALLTPPPGVLRGTQPVEDGAANDERARSPKRA